MKDRSTGVSIVLVLLMSLWLRFPTISANLPYFHDEDEAHHFNRTVEMVKSGDFNPHYFHKPSLHFYLRMPVVAFSFLQAVSRGELRSIKEIRTRDSFGIAGYAFTASHPRVVKWVRMVSLFFTLGIILLTYLIGRELFHSRLIGWSAALFAALSPELLRYSGVIGVDTLMTLLCVATTYSALRCYRHYSKGLLAVTGLLAGLAVSSKYNAAPAALIPLLTILILGRKKWQDAGIATISPIAGFLIGSPYILASLPLFLDQLAYEIWHYKIAGHAGHTAEPGIAQSVFYLSWLTDDGVGFAATLAGVIGIFALWRRDLKRRLIFFAFPALFFLLMVGQRVNFTRNMLVLIPYISLLAAYVLRGVGRRIHGSSHQPMIAMALLIGITIVQPLTTSLDLRHKLVHEVDSRTAFSFWFRENRSALGDFALAGQLQLEPALYGSPRSARIDQSTPIGELYQQGFDLLALGPGRRLSPEEASMLILVREFDGERTASRIVRDPLIRVFSFRPGSVPPADLIQTVRFSKLTPSAPATCATPGGTEDYCWLTKRVSTLDLGVLHDAALGADSGSAVTLRLEMMSPWANQTGTLAIGGLIRELEMPAPGTWKTIEVKIPRELLTQKQPLSMTIGAVHSPALYGLSSDTRRLGVAIRSAGIHP